MSQWALPRACFSQRWQRRPVACIKAFSQSSFTKWLAKGLPDRRKTIGDRERRHDVGEIIERVGFLPFRDAPAEVLRVRRLTRKQALEEQARPEAVLWHKEAASFRPGLAASVSFPAAAESFRRKLPFTDER